MKNTVLLLTILAGSLFIWGCSSGDEKLVYAYQDRIVDTLSVIAAENGILPDFVEGKIFSSGPQTVEALISGSADVAAMGDSAAIILLSRFDHFKIIGSHGSGEKRHRIIVGKDQTIDNWNDLADLRIGIKKGTSTYGGLVMKAREEGVELEDSLIEMSPSVQLTALASGEIDALIASEPTPSIAEDKGIGRHFDYLDMPGMSYPIVLVATDKTVREKEDKLRELVASLEKASIYLGNNRDKVVSIHSELSGFSEALVKNSLSLHNHILLPSSAVKNTMEKLERILRETGNADGDGSIDWARALDNTIIREY